MITKHLDEMDEKDVIEREGDLYRAHREVDRNPKSLLTLKRLSVVSEQPDE